LKAHSQPFRYIFFQRHLMASWSLEIILLHLGEKLETLFYENIILENFFL